MGRALEIRDELSAAELRARAARERKNRPARRMLAIANALEGMSRAAAARAAGMDRQALRGEADQPTVQWTVGPPNVVRYNTEGIDGLYDRPTPGRPPALTEAELALLSERIFAGPDPETDGMSSWTLPDLCRWIEARFGKRLPPQSLSVRGRP